MKLLAKENAVKFDTIYNERFNCIDFNVYPHDWMADHWLEAADCKKTVDENDRYNHHGLDYYYPIKHDKVSTFYRTYSHFKFTKFTDSAKLSKTEHAPFKFMEVLATPAAAQNLDLA